MPTALSYTFTSQAEIERLYTSEGASLQITDLVGSSVATLWAEVIADATTEMSAYLQGQYQDSDLYNNYWVRRRATWIAAYRLSQRAGSPPQFAERYLQILEELEKVQNGQLMIPDVPVRSDLAPSMSAVEVDPRYMRQNIRVIQSISVGETSGRQFPSYFWPVEWY